MQLLELNDLERSLPSTESVFDSRLAEWVIDIVSKSAAGITKAGWATPADVPAAAQAVLGLAARRLYTNPDRFTREAEGDYSYGLDSSVTKADIFTPNEKATLMEYAVQPRVKGIGVLGTTRGDQHPGYWGLDPKVRW